MDFTDINNAKKHIPNILLRQLLVNTSKEYFSNGFKDEAGLDINILDKFKSSISRFHAALLFIDISGFTSLSQRVSVEPFKNLINSYFTKIIDIIDEFGGEVIKFAGDAMFVIWETKFEVINHSSVKISRNKTEEELTINEAMKQCALQCTICGLEITRLCQNYEITFTDINGIENCTSLLNLHSGVAMSYMAGIDLSECNRSEYFVYGRAIDDVAKAEKQAQPGEVIISSTVYQLLKSKTKYFIFKEMEESCYKVESAYEFIPNEVKSHEIVSVSLEDLAETIWFNHSTNSNSPKGIYFWFSQLFV